MSNEIKNEDLKTSRGEMGGSVKVSSISGINSGSQVTSPRNEEPEGSVGTKSSSKEEKKESTEITKLLKQGRLQWTDQTEELLSSWADIAACYKWLHESSFRKYSSKNYWFAVPVIVLSTIAGTLSVSIQGYVPTEYVSFAQAGIGAMNIFTGILTTLQSLFKYAQTSESHNNVSIGWSKLQRNISIELSVSRESRKDADSFIKICRSEYDRLIEQSPTISVDIINLFKSKFAEQSDKRREDLKKRLKRKQKMLIKKGLQEEADKIEEEMDYTLEEDELILPDICDSIQHTKIFRDSVNPFQIQIGTGNQDSGDEKITSDFYTETIKKILPEVKEAIVKDRIKMLDEKISGANQYKLALMGERMAPIMNEIIETKEKEIDKLINRQIENKIRTRAISELAPVEEKEIIENVKKPIIDKLYSVNYNPPKIKWSPKSGRRHTYTEQSSNRSRPSLISTKTSFTDNKKEVLKELETIKSQNKVKAMLHTFEPVDDEPDVIHFGTRKKESPIIKIEKIEKVGIPLLDLTEAYKKANEDLHSTEEFNDKKTERSIVTPNATPETPPIHIKIDIQE